MPELLKVQVCHARPERVFLKDLLVTPGTTLQQALQASGLLQAEPQLDLQTVKVGVHGKLKTLDTVLRDGDRVEIYRSLLADPKDARRRRAVKERKAQGGR